MLRRLRCDIYHMQPSHLVGGWAEVLMQKLTPAEVPNYNALNYYLRCSSHLEDVSTVYITRVTLDIAALKHHRCLKANILHDSNPLPHHPHNSGKARAAISSIKEEK